MNRRVLALETSARAASCAIVCEGKVEAAAYQDVGLTHSRTLMPMVRDMFNNSGLSLADCGYVAVAHGPGSFTGVRIGVAAAKGLAAGAKLRCVGVSTLEAMAELLAFERAIICCSMDARRGEVYNAIFLSPGGGALERLSADRAVAAEQAAQEARKFAGERDFSIIHIGDGAELCYNLLRDLPRSRLAPPHLLRQSAVGVAFAAEHAISSGLACAPDELKAVYLRLSQAERERARQTRTQM